VIVLSSFTSTCGEGPAVSLNGSPMVLPTKLAAATPLCCGTRWP
jgi:hypothetical protein